MSNHGIKSDIKRATSVDTSDFAEKGDLASLKSEIDKLDIDDLETFVTDLNKLSNLVDDVVKKTVYDELVKKVSAIVSKS